jgi:hypothetical protein
MNDEQITLIGAILRQGLAPPPMPLALCKGAAAHLWDGECEEE